MTTMTLNKSELLDIAHAVDAAARDHRTRGDVNADRADRLAAKAFRYLDDVYSVDPAWFSEYGRITGKGCCLAD